VLLRFEDPGAAAIQISGTFQEGGDEWVVVRADVVIDGEYNLVVPVDAADEAWLQVVLGNLAKVPGLIKVKVLRVESYNPSPSHRAHSYVTASEVDEFRVPEFAEPGRHPKSPGANPWG
jgi:hypothetical protein